VSTFRLPDGAITSDDLSITAVVCSDGTAVFRIRTVDGTLRTVEAVLCEPAALSPLPPVDPAAPDRRT
jgi:hypothetical protein